MTCFSSDGLTVDSAVAAAPEERWLERRAAELVEGRFATGPLLESECAIRFELRVLRDDMTPVQTISAMMDLKAAPQFISRGSIL
jgi:hypothetical protein